MENLYTLERIKEICFIDKEEVDSEKGETTLYGTFTIRIGSISIFANKIKFSKLTTVMFVYVYKPEGVVAMYQYDVRTKELIL